MKWLYQMFEEWPFTCFWVIQSVWVTLVIVYLEAR
jgi:hypothetical protein